MSPQRGTWGRGNLSDLTIAPHERVLQFGPFVLGPVHELSSSSIAVLVLVDMEYLIFTRSPMHLDGGSITNC